MAKRPLPSFLIFRDKQGNWRWNFAGPGGRILAASSQAYTRSEGCVRTIKLLKGSNAIPVLGRGSDIEAARAKPEGQAARKAKAAPPTEGKSEAKKVEVGAGGKKVQKV